MRARNGKKTCSKCGKEFPATSDYFHRKANAVDGFRCYCKQCVNTYQEGYREEHREKIRARQQTYNEEHREQARVYRRENQDKIKAYREANRKKIRAQMKHYGEANREKLKAYRQANREKIAARNKGYYEANREKKCAAVERWRKSHLEKRCASSKRYNHTHQEKIRIYQNQRFTTQPKLRVSRSISASIRQSLRKGKGGQHWEDLIGCSLEELMNYLESLWAPGMAWENYGKWHLDHINPIASFSFTSADDSGFKECWTLHNLQPMWAKENLQKGATWDGQHPLPFASKEAENANSVA